MLRSFKISEEDAIEAAEIVNRRLRPILVTVAASESVAFRTMVEELVDYLTGESPDVEAVIAWHDKQEKLAEESMIDADSDAEAEEFSIMAGVHKKSAAVIRSGDLHDE